jgi:hypothetical protein
VNQQQAKAYAMAKRDQAQDRNEWMRWENYLVQLMATDVRVRLAAEYELERLKEAEDDGNYTNV